MIHSTVRIIARAERENEVLKILCSLAERTRALSGCINCSVYKDLQLDHAILLDQRWNSQENLMRHLCSDDYRNVLLSMEMASEQPDVRFESVTHAAGLEMIKKARTGKTGMNRRAAAGPGGK